MLTRLAALSQPSIVPATSRLRPAIGLPHLRFLDIDYRNFDETSTKTFLPAVWLAPGNRLALVSRIYKIIYDLPFPIAMHHRHTKRDLGLALSSKIGNTARRFHLTNVSEGTVDWQDTFLGHLDHELETLRVCKAPPEVAVTRFPSFLRASRPFGRTRCITMDLCRIVLDPPPSATMIHLRTIATGLATREKLHKSAQSVEVVFCVATDEVAKVVEDVLASASSTHPTHRCRIDQA